MSISSISRVHFLCVQGSQRSVKDIACRLTTLTPFKFTFAALHEGAPVKVRAPVAIDTLVAPGAGLVCGIVTLIQAAVASLVRIETHLC